MSPKTELLSAILDIKMGLLKLDIATKLESKKETDKIREYLDELKATYETGW